MVEITGSIPVGPTKLNMKKKMKGKDKGKGDDEKLFAFLCYLISIIGVVIVLATKKERGEYSLYHAGQGMALFIAEIIVWIIAAILGFIPILGAVVAWILWVLIAVLWIIGMVNALTDKKVKLPVVGQYGERFKF